MSAHDWRDICARCHAIVDMPPDGSAADHLCPHDFVTIEMLRERVGLARPAAHSLKDHVLDLGEAARLVDPVIPPAALDVRRTGPFLPASPPPICFVCDLLLWTRQDLLALPNVGRHSLKRITSWLARYGHTLAERDEVAFRAVTGAQLSASLSAVRRYAEAHDPFSYDQRHIVALPDDELPAGESRTIEFRAERRLRIAGLFIPPVVALDILILAFRAGHRDLIVDYNTDNPVIEPGEVVSLTVENVSQRTIRLIGTLQVDVAVNVLDEIPASTPLPPFVGSRPAQPPNFPPTFPSGPWPWLTRD